MCLTVEDAFRCKFLDPPADSSLPSNSQIFKQYLDIAISKITVHLSYTSIVQSSGWGKSRAAIEFCQRFKIPCLYLCLRHSNQTGFPQRSQHASTILENLRKIKDYAQTLFRNATYCAFTDAFMEKSENLVSWHNCDDFWQVVLGMGKQKLSDDQIAKFIVSQKAKHGIQSVDCPVNALFVFDEARELLPDQNSSTSDPQSNLFLTTRRAIHELRPSMIEFKLFVVYLDTHSKLANFSPSKHADSSSARLQGYELQNPFIAISNHPWLFSVDRKLNPDHPYDPRFFGRPLWKSTLEAKYPIAHILSFAVVKLICSSEPFSALHLYNRYNASLAVVCCCLGMSVVPSSEKSSVLVASHMVRVLFIMS